ncbi:MAG TPA: UDP-glucose 4-epimerase GalE [Amaricoccus sp.]|nr:UDP-glucose 4-epimerase GalE [Amaricoccus sp.]
MTGTILVTGGAGYIGSHVVAELLAAGRRVVILDDFSNAARDVPERIAALGLGAPELVEGDVCDAQGLDALFARHQIDAVVHMAGLKAVAESVAEPLRYVRVNVGGAVALFEAMLAHGVGRLVFSSSATVYGVPEQNPIPEGAPLAAVNPYGRTKLVIEQTIDELVLARPDFAAVSLRYFNPVGAHASRLIGEDPRGVPNNLFPYIAQTAAGIRERVSVYGDDYPTPDGTAIRDYIHVVDLARGHLAALDFLLAGQGAGRNAAVNLGRGRGHSVLEAVAAFGAAVGRPIPYAIAPRRQGDVAESVADPRLAAELLGWRAELDLERMCADQWAFQSRLLAP